MKRLAVRKPLAVWLALLLLLALTAASSLLPLGAFNSLVNFAIACAKTALVLVFFMHIGRGDAAVRVVAAAGLLWLGFLVALSLVDFVARGYG